MSTQRDRDAFLAQPHVAILATMSPGNRPHAMPVWYIVEDGALLILTGRGSQKHRNIERNAAVSVTVDRRNPPYYALMIQGRAEIGPAPSRALHLRLSTRYLGPERGAAYTAQSDVTDSITIRLRPEKTVEYGAP